MAPILPPTEGVTTPPIVEVLAEEFYLAVMQATADQWVRWEHAPQSAKSGYYDLAFEVAERVYGFMAGAR